MRRSRAATAEDQSSTIAAKLLALRQWVREASRELLFRTLIWVSAPPRFPGYRCSQILSCALAPSPIGFARRKDLSKTDLLGRISLRWPSYCNSTISG